MRILVILLFISFNSFGQITLQDILAIDDRRSFQKLMIENGFQEETDPQFEGILTSYRKYKTIDNTLNSFSWRITDSVGLGGVTGYFSENVIGENEIYDAIYDEVKKSCVFMDIIDESSTGKDVAYYNCPDIDADPRLIELDEKIKKEYKDIADRGYRVSDIQIGFTKSEDLFIIEYPMQEIGVEDKIKLVEMMLEMSKKE